MWYNEREQEQDVVQSHGRISGYKRLPAGGNPYRIGTNNRQAGEAYPVHEEGTRIRLRHDLRLVFFDDRR